MAKINIPFNVPFMKDTLENKKRVRDLLVYALRDMLINNKHLIDVSGNVALARLVTNQISYPLNGDRAEAVREEAKEAGLISE